MKKYYYSPELEVTLLLAEDVLTASQDPELEDEVELEPGEGFWD